MTWGGGDGGGGRRGGLDSFTNSPFVKCIFVRWWIRDGDADDERGGWGGVAGDEIGVKAGDGDAGGGGNVGAV